MDHQEQLISDLNGEDDLGCVLRGHIHLENGIDTFLESKCKNVKYLKKADLTYDQKLHMALSLGLPEVLSSPLKYIGNLRNEFSHNLGRKLGKQEVENFYKSFDGGEKDYLHQVIGRVNKANPSDRKKLKTMSVKEKFAIYIISLQASLCMINGGSK